MFPGFTIALQTRDFASRKAFLEDFRNRLEDASLLLCENDKNQNGHGEHHSELILEEDDPSIYYPILLRLAYECPFKDVRFGCEDILSKSEAKGFRVPRRKTVGPSRFISSKVCVGIDTDDQEVQDLYVDAFLLNGRTSHIHQLLAYHIRYFSCFLKFESLLMQSNNAPLPLDWRYYIGIMSASKHRCGYLVEECKDNFLLESGNEKWLDGIQFAPIKLQKLDSLNRLLAHQPWLISDEIIEDLLAGPAAERWSVSELIHAVLVMAHYLALSGLVFGCGVNPEIDMKNGHTIRTQSASGYSSSGSEPLTPTRVRGNSLDSKWPFEEPGTTTGLLERIQRVQQEESAILKAENEQEEKLRQFQEVENKELTENESDIDISCTVNIDCSYDKFNYTNGDFHYEEYQKMKPKNVNVFRAQDFNWQEHCFSFIDHSFPTMGFSLDEKFSCTYELTYRTIGDSITNIDTSKFRLATWNYIHLIYGIYHDDYQYVEVNKLLEKSYKSFIKKVACFPERITLVDFEDFFTDFLPSEKVHINLLVLESRFQAILLYASRSIMNHMNKYS